MLSYTICIPTPIARGQAKGKETGKTILFRSPVNSLRTEDVFPVVASLPRETRAEKNRMLSQAIQLRIMHVLNLYFFTGCDNSDRDKQLKQVFKNSQSVKKT